MYPIFFSVASKDIDFAEALFEKIPDGLTYLYSKTGVEGAHLWDEISEQELPTSKAFVVFWSANYVTAKGCIKEIIQAHELMLQNRIRPLILRLDDFPITMNNETNPDLEPVFLALGAMLNYRTSAASIDVQHAAELVQRLVEPLLGSEHPRWPRHDLEPLWRTAAQIDKFLYYPVMWISGFNGVGRESLVRDFNRNFVPNGRGVLVEINEMSQPKQILLRIESLAFNVNSARLKQINEHPVDKAVEALRDVVDRVHDLGDYVIFKHTRVIDENEELPSWLDELASSLSPSRRPKLAVISQLPLIGERRAKTRASVAPQRVSTLDSYELSEFCYQLISYFDHNPSRWSEREVSQVVKAAGGTIGFLVSLIRSASNIDDFDTIEQLIAADSINMAGSITNYVRWAFNQLHGSDDEQKTLIFLNDVSPCDLVDLELAIRPTKPILRVLGKLLDLGLIEREDDSLYRLTPLLSNRLSRDLIKPDNLIWLRRALVDFVKIPMEMQNSYHEYLRIESRIQASLLGEVAELPEGITQFVSAAHWFQAGVRLYHSRRREPAYRLLKKAYLARNEFRTESRVELTRYFCLSATRNRKYDEAQKCIDDLDKVYSNKGMAAFLGADLLDHKRKYVEAIIEYERSLELNKDKQSRLERTYRPLIQCILASPRPDFAQAERYAKKWLELRQTVFSLMALPRVYLNWKHRGHIGLRPAPDDIDTRLKSALSILESDPGAGSAVFELKAEEAELTGDYDQAINYMDSAIQIHPRFELRTERWRFMAKSGLPALATQVISELEAGRSNQDYKSNWIPFLPTLVETYALALLVLHKPLGSMNAFSVPLSSDEVGAIIARVRRWKK